MKQCPGCVEVVSDLPVSYRDYWRDGKLYHFCTPRCLVDWLRERGDTLEGRCDACGEERESPLLLLGTAGSALLRFCSYACLLGWIEREHAPLAFPELFAGAAP